MSLQAPSSFDSSAFIFGLFCDYESASDEPIGILLSEHLGLVPSPHSNRWLFGQRGPFSPFRIIYLGLKLSRIA